MSTRTSQFPDLISDCPAWCADGPEQHSRAVAEGVGVEEVTHCSVELLSKPSQVLREQRGMIDMYLLQPATPPFGGYPVVVLDVLEGTGSACLNLTTGEARRLAAQLLYLADLEDLHHNGGGLR